MHKKYIAIDKYKVAAEGNSLPELFVELHKIYGKPPAFKKVYKEKSVQIYREVKCGT